MKGPKRSPQPLPRRLPLRMLCLLLRQPSAASLPRGGIGSRRGRGTRVRGGPPSGKWHRGLSEVMLRSGVHLSRGNQVMKTLSAVGNSSAQTSTPQVMSLTASALCWQFATRQHWLPKREWYPRAGRTAEWQVAQRALRSNARKWRSDVAHEDVHGLRGRGCHCAERCNPTRGTEQLMRTMVELMLRMEQLMRTMAELMRRKVQPMRGTVQLMRGKVQSMCRWVQPMSATTCRCAQRHADA